MKKSVTATLLCFISLITFSLIASAEDSQPNREWVGAVGFVNFSDEEDGLSVSLNGIVGSLGYKIRSSNNLTLIPQVRIGFGISDDTLSIPRYYDVKVQLDSFLALSMRGEIEFNNGIYAFATPSYANAQITAISRGYSETDDDWEFGIGAGAGYNFSETASTEFSYERFDSTDVFTLGVRYDF